MESSCQDKQQLLGRKDSLAPVGKGRAPLMAVCAEISHLPAKSSESTGTRDCFVPWCLNTEGDLGLTCISPHHQERTAVIEDAHTFTHLFT